MAGHFFTTIENNVTGKPVNGATMLVYVAGATVVDNAVTGGTLATIYSDDGITTVDQDTLPLTSDSYGFVEFWTDETTVVIEISYDGEAKKTVTDVEILGGTVSSDVTALAARVDKHDTLLGTSASALDLDTFTGTTIPDDSSVKEALQALESAVETGAISGAVTSSGLTMSTARLLGRTTASTGAIEEISAGTGLSLSGGSLSVSASDVKTTENIIVACTNETTAIAASNGVRTFRMPYAFTLTAIKASLTGATATGTFTVDVNEGGSTILSTKLTIDATEKTSTSAATAVVISDSSLADDAEITIDVDDAGDGTATGLKVTFIGHRT
jgi:hypothetical protein